MRLPFTKYHGTGNDFILIDNRSADITLSREQVAFLCHRRFGIGADGLMLLEKVEEYDFRMVYFNADGGESTMCGNGGRCIVAFARNLGLIRNETTFLAVDGPHKAWFNDHDRVSLSMADVTSVENLKDCTRLNTGSPHLVYKVTDLCNYDVVGQGRMIRNRAEYQPDGINVNFVEATREGLFVRTYERGVEDETYSCGTGVTAAAIANTGTATGSFNTQIETPGGRLEVSFYKDQPDAAREVVLTGPAVQVFEGLAFLP